MFSFSIFLINTPHFLVLSRINRSFNSTVKEKAEVVMLWRHAALKSLFLTFNLCFCLTCGVIVWWSSGNRTVKRAESNCGLVQRENVRSHVSCTVKKSASITMPMGTGWLGTYLLQYILYVTVCLKNRWRLERSTWFLTRGGADMWLGSAKE